MKKIISFLPILYMASFFSLSCTDEISLGPGDWRPCIHHEDHRQIQEQGAVDLGLSVKWAACNIGANKPEEYGDYFAWGETKPKSFYNLESYKWCGEKVYTEIWPVKKYCATSRFGTVDNKITLDPEDDAAHINWGSAWRLPTSAEQAELVYCCTWTWTTRNGVKGYKVTSKNNGNSIFLPAAGHRFWNSLYDAGSTGHYWTSSLNKSYSNEAEGLRIYPSGIDAYSYGRYFGYSVRPVCP